MRYSRRLVAVGTVLLMIAAGCAPALPRVTVTSTPTAGISPLPAARGAPAAPITLTYWEEDNDAAEVLLDELAAAFTRANPGITIKRVHFSYDDLRNQFRAASLLSSHPPDMVRAPGEFTGPFGELQIVKPVGAIFPAGILDGFLPGAIEGATLNSQVWGLPDNFGGHLMLLYNKALVDRAPADTDAWAEQLKKLTLPEDGQYGLVFDTTESFWLVPWLAGFGGWPLDAHEQPALDTAEMVEALWFLHDLKFEDKVIPEKSDYRAAFDLFSQGKAAYIIDGMWNMDKYSGLGVDLGVATLPRVSKTRQLPAPMGTGHYWFVEKSVSGDKLAAAAQFVEFMTSPATQQEWLTKMRRLPSSKQALASKAITSDPALSTIVEQMRIARGVPPALEMTCVWRGMDAYFGKVMSDEISPDDAPPKMQAEASACVSDMTPETPTPAATSTP